ncbi:TIGR03862 family flavoprotein [Acidovorax sp. MR-S7]|uniref:TIGR03862 family flavoprotein n=1 Tax=Acidovorax sp. MR-S7 TaxID=1268622 RepID=UPI0003712464|nr:TIGR03862 family flavoprotein [Acidovorax sp. MR-S7]GAD23964.1 predicted flavoproteins [Acidovorax sp. MR-S7]
MTDSLSCDIAVIGAGPAGLMAAEAAASASLRVHVFDAMPSVGRKFLLAGKGGLNLTHSEPPASFLTRYGARQEALAPWLSAFGATELRAWADALGAETFVGTSGRVFPKDMKAAPLLRAWLHRLRAQGVRFHMRHRWLGWTDEGGLHFATTQGEAAAQARAVVLALGGGSWARLGSDGAWVPLLAQRGVPVAPLLPANCGFDVPRVDAPAGETRRDFFRELIGRGPAPAVGWTPFFAERFAGRPFKPVALSFTDSQGRHFARRGEFVATATGVEGSLVYAVSSLLRGEIEAHGHATFHLDLLPDHSPERVLAEVRHPRGARSLTSHLKGRLGLEGIKTAVLYEQLGKDGMHDPVALAHAIKALPITVVASRPLDEAISTAGGVPFEALDERLMLRDLPGVFCAGEMLDWEAPTGGYLLTACCATGRAAGEGAAGWAQNLVR